MTELAKTYTPSDVEPAVIERWLAARAFHAEPDDPGDPYCIVIPPPNVTAALHMGHALNNTLQDILIRWRRMVGDNAMWMPGTDHAGIATQTVVEKRVLQEEGKRRTDFDRDTFVGKIQAWKDEYEARITDQLKRMGCSCDWDRQRFTMDDICAKAVREAFFRLFADGLIYRGKRLVNWDPVTQTALADDEVEMQQVDGHFWYMRYPLAEPVGDITHVTVATTRPETMLGDTAVAINPSDPRAAVLRGKKVLLPIVNRRIPIIEDDYVVLPDPESSDEKARFSSGFLKVTPAHDPNDYEIGQRFSLPMINVMAPDASISLAHGWGDAEPHQADNAALKPLLGLSRQAAREAVVQWFKDHDLLAEVKPYRHSVGHSYRSHVPIEPYLSDQWYVKVTDDRLRGAALRALAPEQTPDAETSGKRKRPQFDQLPTPEVPDRAYLLTWTCHGTWLHGDERGSVDHQHNQVGLPFLAADPQREHQRRAQTGSKPIHLDEAARSVVCKTIQEVCEHRHWTLLAVNVRSNHVHCVVAADAPPEKVMSDFKAWATRRLVEAHTVTRGRKVWTEHGSTRWISGSGSVEAACRYVLDEQGQNNPGCIAGSMIQAVADASRSLQGNWHGKLRFTPARYARTFQQWHENIRDWCISRQLWWGHRIPVWHGPAAACPVDQTTPSAAVQIAGETAYVCVREEDGELTAQLQAAGFTQDPDVLDTWFSSALWPISTLGWPEENPALQVWNPSNTLCTAREIITLWVSRMVMFNLYLRDCLPFTDVFIHAMIQDGHGQKMSKSLGNGVDPLDIIHSHGSDAMRFTLAGMTTQTQDVRMPVDMVCPHTGETFTPKFITTPAGHKVAAPIQACPSDPSKKMVSSFGVASGQAAPSDDLPLARNTSEKFDVGRNFSNKLWNAVRFALGHLRESQADALPTDAPIEVNSLADRWILTRLFEVIAQTDQALSRFEFKVYADGLYDFIWRDLCDWYIEAIKPTVRQDAAQQRVLAAVLDVTLRLLHPVMPFITEKLWTSLNDIAPQRGLPGLPLQVTDVLCLAHWPAAQDTLADPQAKRAFELVRDVTTALRAVRTQYKLPPRQQVDGSVAAPPGQAATLQATADLIQTLAGVRLTAVGPDTARPENAAATVLADMQLFLHDLVDPQAEKQRLGKQVDQLQASIRQLEGRLANKNYVDKAPAHLVEQTRQQLAEAQQQLTHLQQQLR